jgi:hypothetical protein
MDDPFAVRQRLHQRRHGELGAPVAQEAHDQLALDAEDALGVHLRPADAADNDAERHAAAGMRLRIEEHLGVTHVVGMRLDQIGEGEIVEIGLMHKHPHTLVVDF